MAQLNLSSTPRLAALAAATTSLAIVMNGGSAKAITLDLTVQGTDAIYLAGRTDVTIPPLDSSFVLARHNFPLSPSDFLPETFPQSVVASSGEIFSFSATGGINYFNGYGPPFYGPDGNGVSGSNISNLGGISGYQGPQGPLVGLFLNNDNPASSPAPAALNFTPSGIGTEFSSLAPALGQVFYIGDGLTGTGSGAIQKFIAPIGATRLFLGIADGFSFSGVPGFYEDNDGSFKVTVSTSVPATAVPEPTSTLGILAFGSLFATNFVLKRQLKK